MLWMMGVHCFKLDNIFARRFGGLGRNHEWCPKPVSLPGLWFRELTLVYWSQQQRQLDCWIDGCMEWLPRAGAVLCFAMTVLQFSSSLQPALFREGCGEWTYGSFKGYWMKYISWTSFAQGSGPVMGFRLIDYNLRWLLVEAGWE